MRCAVSKKRMRNLQISDPNLTLNFNPYSSFNRNPDADPNLTRTLTVSLI